MSVDNLNNEFGEWNPMENDYKSKEFNRYDTGPGANLDDALQPCEQSTEAKGAPKPFLMFRNLHPKMTTKALYRICERYGNVIAVRDSLKCPFFFADFATVADMEATFRALENNTYGFIVHVGDERKKKNVSKDNNAMISNSNTAPKPRQGINYQNRTVQVSAKLHPRPMSKQSPIVTQDFIGGLSADVLNNDAHFLEREGICKTKQNDKYKYQTGRHIPVMPLETQNFIKKKHEESLGRYSPTKEMYEYNSDGNLLTRNFQKCLSCGRDCDNFCSRCNGYYCNLECQKKDWKQHRYICGKPEHLQTKPPRREDDLSKTHAVKQTASPSENRVLSNEIPGSGNIVTITAINKTNLVFIRSKTSEAYISYFKTVDGLQSLGKNLKPLKSLPECGQVVVNKFHNQINRAIVLSAKNPEKIYVNYMDYGNTDNLRLEDLYDAPEEYIRIPRHAIPVMLKGVPVSYMTEVVRNFMYSYLNDINVYIKYKPEDYNEDKNVYEVELIDETTQQNLNRMILTLSQPVEPKSTAKICYKHYLKQELLPIGKNVELVVMDNSLMMVGCISCTTKPYAIEIHKFQSEFQKYGESLKNECYTPRADELCIAKYSVDGLWCRGRCLEAVGDGHPTILFIDYGNISMVNIKNIRRYPSEFTYPVCTVDCEIQGLPQSCSADIVEKLEELIPNGSIIKCESIDMVNKNVNLYTIALPGILKKITAAGLL